MGTWDFKWPQDSRIRFAFQRPPDVSDAEFGEARSKVMALARLWLRDVDGCKPRIDIVDTGITLPAPSVAQRGRQNRSATWIIETRFLRSAGFTRSNADHSNRSTA